MTVRNVWFLAVLTLFGLRTQILADSFKFEPIPSLYGNEESGPFIINNSNQVAFVETYDDAGEATVYTPPSTLIDLPDYPSGTCGLPLNNCAAATVGFNNKGQLVGSSWYQGGDVSYHEANFWNGDAWTQINAPNYNPKSPYPQVVNFGGLNDAGQVVGTYGHVFADHGDPGNLQASIDGSYLWQNGVAKTVVDPSAGSGLTEANDINDSGVIVGAYIDSNGVSHGFIDKGGVFRTLDFPGANGTSLDLVNASGQITGTYHTSAGVSESFFYSGGKFITIAFPGASSTNITGLNDLGEIVGWNPVPDSNDASGFVYENGSYIGVAPAFDSINDSGVIAGSIDFTEPVIGIPVGTATPEPSSIALLSVALLIGAGAVRLRGR